MNLYDTITSIAMIVDSENCESATFTPDSSANPVVGDVQNSDPCDVKDYSTDTVYLELTPDNSNVSVEQYPF